MRIEISRDGLCSHQESMACERCFSHVIRAEKEGPCILALEEDGKVETTLVVVEGGEQSAYVLPGELVDLIKGESWEVVLEVITPFKVEDLTDQA